MKTIVGVFSTMAQIELVDRELERTGVPPDNISVFAGNDADRH